MCRKKNLLLVAKHCSVSRINRQSILNWVASCRAYVELPSSSVRAALELLSDCIITSEVAGISIIIGLLEWNGASANSGAYPV